MERGRANVISSSLRLSRPFQLLLLKRARKGKRGEKDPHFPARELHRSTHSLESEGTIEQRYPVGIVGPIRFQQGRSEGLCWRILCAEGMEKEGAT